MVNTKNMKLVYDPEVTKVKCKVCRHLFVTQNALNDHVQTSEPCRLVLESSHGQHKKTGGGSLKRRFRLVKRQLENAKQKAEHSKNSKKASGNSKQKKT